MTFEAFHAIRKHAERGVALTASNNEKRLNDDVLRLWDTIERMMAPRPEGN